ncbi:YwaF family protein [Candidatus Izimaplasma bacterium ZiA1]|uniref:TMEM164-related integral membrane acyltransferase n=1 Tax=Candidatus Izimoplasma sp. ZiA1 TaxID=2024899 RepID=UPI00143BB38A
MFFTDEVGIEFTMFGIWHLIPIILTAIGVIVIYLLRDKLRNFKYEKRLRYIIATLGILFELALHLWKVGNGLWTYHHDIPLHLCSLSLFAGVFVMYTKNYKVFEISYFWAVGGLISIMFPDIVFGPDRFRYYQFLFSHMIFFWMFMYMRFVHNFNVNNKSFLKSTTLLLIIVLGLLLPLNLLIDSNYMFLLRSDGTPFEMFEGNGLFMYVTLVIVMSYVVIGIWYLPVFISNKLKEKKLRP